MKATLEYVTALDEIKEATTDGKIKWIRNRPGSFKFKTMNEDLEDLIINFTKIENDYLFSLEKRDFESTQVLLNIDTSSTDSHLVEVLSELYQAVEYRVDLNNLESLNQFVDLIKSNPGGKSILD